MKMASDAFEKISKFNAGLPEKEEEGVPDTQDLEEVSESSSREVTRKQKQADKINAKKKAKEIAANPLVAASIVVLVLGAGLGGIYLLKGVIGNSQAAQAKAAEAIKNPAMDYQALYEKEKAERQGAEADKESLLRAQVAKDPALRVISGKQSLIAAAPNSSGIKSSIPAPLPPMPVQPIQRIRPIERRQIVAYAPQEIRQLPSLPRQSRNQLPPTQSGSGLGMMGRIVNKDEEDATPPQVATTKVAQATTPTKQFQTGISNSRKIGATRSLEAVLTSRVQYVGGGRGTSIPVMAKLVKAVKVGGQVVLPEGTILLGKLTQTANNGFVEIFFEKGRLPGDAEDGTFTLSGVATDIDGGVLVANAPRRPDGGGADALSIASEFFKGAASAGLTTYQTGSNSLGGLTNTTTTTTNTDPVTEGIRQATTKSTSILDRSAAEARQVSRSGNLDFFLEPGKQILILLTQDLIVPPVSLPSEP
jgi:hypothetical protein